MLQLIGFVYAVAGLFGCQRLLQGLRHRRYDPFFVIFVASALIYLEIAPGFIVAAHGLGNYKSFTASVFSSKPTAFAYILVMSASWVLFLVPLLFIYRLRWAPPEADPRGRPATKLGIGPHWRLTCIFSSLLGLAYLEQILSHGLLYRRLGTAQTISQLTGLSTVTYTIVRFYELGAFFLTGVLIIMTLRAQTGEQKVWARTSLVIVSATFLIPSAANSRLGVVVFVLAAGGWWVVATDRELTAPVWTRRAVAGALIGFVLVQVALNTRAVENSNLQHLGPAPSIRLYSPLSGDGLHRLDGVDLMARLEPVLAKTSLPWGKAWQEAPWLLGRRYIDPSGYRAFVANGQTTAKQYLTKRYLGIAVDDFYSCLMTDMFGNFWWFGFPLAALIFGLGYNFIRRRIAVLDTGHPAWLMIAMFVASGWLMFEIEADQLLFGVVTTAPLLVMLLAFPPLALVPREDVEPSPQLAAISA